MGEAVCLKIEVYYIEKGLLLLLALPGSICLDSPANTIKFIFKRAQIN